MEKYISKKYLLDNLKNFKSEILDKEYDASTKMDKVNPVGEGTLKIPFIETTDIESEGMIAASTIQGMPDPLGEYEGYRALLTDDVWYSTTGEFGRWEERHLSEDMHDLRFGLAQASYTLSGKADSVGPNTTGLFRHKGDFEIKDYDSDEVVASIYNSGWGSFKRVFGDTVCGDEFTVGYSAGKNGVINLYRDNRSDDNVVIIQEKLLDYKSVPPRLVEVPLVESDDSGIKFNGHTLESDVPADAKFTDTVITQSDVAGWGFTKNTGTYSKPSGGIPASDLASGVIPTTLPASDVKAWAKADSKPSYTASEVGALASTVTHLSGDIASTEKGSANGVATLGSDGKIPSSQLPSYVDDVLEYSAKTSFPTTGETGKIYVNTADNKTYRWSGSAYVEISPSLALGETSSTAYAGDKGKALADKLKNIESGAQVNVQSDWNVTDTTSKAYIKNKPTIPSAVTSDTVSGWGFTKNTGTYSKPSGGIPASDLASGVIPTSLPANGGTATNVSGTVAIANGGTGATTALGARTNLGLGGAATKGVDTSISAASTSANLPTAAAVASFVEGKGYKTTDNNTTYTFATGDGNGQIKVTPSGGTAQNITVKGLGSLAYSSATIPTVVNNLTSDDTGKALSAKQGKELKSLIDAINTTLNNLEILDEEAL